MMFIFHFVADVKFLLFNLHIHCAVWRIQFEVPILLTIYDICSNFRIGTGECKLPSTIVTWYNVLFTFGNCCI